MDEAGIKMIFTDSKARRYIDVHGNRYFREGRAVILRDGHLKNRRVFDVIFKRAPLN